MARLTVSVAVMRTFSCLALLLQGWAAGKTISGTFSSERAKASVGQYVTTFTFSGHTAGFQYSLEGHNWTTPIKIYLFLDQDWDLATKATVCSDKFSHARHVYDIVNSTGSQDLQDFEQVQTLHVVYADTLTCIDWENVSADKHNTIDYEFQLFNPDSLGNPTDHFSLEESGLLRFYQLLTLVYFVLGCIFGPQIYEMLQKKGPMNMVMELLASATCLQGLAIIFELLHLRRYSNDGYGASGYEFCSNMFEVQTHVVMLFLLMSVSVGWAMGGNSKISLKASLKKLFLRPATKIITGIAAVQALLFLWEEATQDHYHLYSPGIDCIGAIMLFLRISLAAIFTFNLHAVISSERSALKKEFYKSFANICVLWFMCYPVLYVLTWVITKHLQYKCLTVGVVLCQSLSLLLLYRLFLSRSLYWEVSALGSTLPLTIKVHS